VGLDIDTALVVLVDVFAHDLAGEPDCVPQIDELTILGITTFKPAPVPHPVGQKLSIPAMALNARIVSIQGSGSSGGRDGIMHAIDRLPAFCHRVSEAPGGMFLIDSEGSALIFASCICPIDLLLLFCF
jgi:hypothetical protein